MRAGDPRTPEPENAATRTIVASAPLIWTDLEAALDRFAPDATGAARQSGITRGLTAADRAEWRDILGSMAATYDGYAVEPLAVRGDRLALLRQEFTADGYVTDGVLLVELDERGSIFWLQSFDIADLPDAVDVLEARCAALQGDAYTDAERNWVRAMAAWRRGDWDAFTETMQPDFVRTDRSLLGVGVEDRDAYVASMRAFSELLPGFVPYATKYDVSGRAAVLVLRRLTTDAQGTEYEWRLVLVTRLGPDGRAAELVTFDEEQWQEALGLFDEWSAASVAPASSGPENAATRVAADFLPTLTSGDVEGIRAFIADGYRYVDHRFSGVSPDAEGFDAYLAQMRAYAEVGFREVMGEILAVRGERFLLARTENESPEGYRSVELRVGAIDDDRRFVRTDVYDEADLARAVADMNAQYRDSGESTAEEMRALDAIDALNRRDWDALRAALDPDVVAIDHQQLGFEPTDRDGIVSDWMTGLVAMTPDAVSVVVEVSGREPAAFFRIVTRGDTVDGSAYEWDALCVGRFGAGARLEFFPLDRRADALALLAEWSGGSEPPAPAAEQRLLENALTRTMARHDAGEFARDPESAIAATAEDIVLIDRRPGPSLGTITGRDAWFENLGAIVDTFGSVVTEIVAVRGDRLAVARVRFSSSAGFENIEYDVFEANDDGQVHRVVAFGADDLGAAMAELDERYLAGEGAAHTDLIRRLGDTARAIASGEADAYATLFAADCVVANHRHLSLPMDSVGAVVESARALTDVVGARASVFEYVECRADAMLVRQHQMLVTPEGSEYSLRFIVVSHLAGGLWDVLETYDLEDIDTARARLHELGVRRTPAIDNLALRRFVRGHWLAERGDFDDQGTLAEDVVYIDRRLLAETVITGRDAFVENLKVLFELFEHRTIEPLAVRGDRAALLRYDVATVDGFEQRGYGVLDCDEVGRLTRYSSFDESDLVAALEELDVGYSAVTSNLAPAESAVLAGYAALDRRDWTAFAGCLDDDLVIVDHRRLGFPPGHGRAALTGELQSLVDQVPDVVAYVTRIRARGRVALATTHQRGTATVGGEATWDFHTVVTVGVDDRITSHEYFDFDRWDDALARYDDLATDPRTPDIANEATRSMERLWRSSRQDVAAASSMCAEDIELIDRRSVVALPGVRGPVAVMAEYLSLFEVYDDLRVAPFAVRGEHLALFSLAAEAHGFETTALLLCGVDGDRRLERLTLFDQADLAGALEELEARHLELLGDAASDLDRALANALITINRRDPDAYERIMVPDVTIVDHLPLNFPPAHRASDFTRMLRRLYELAPDTLFLNAKVLIAGARYSPSTISGAPHRRATDTSGCATWSMRGPPMDGSCGPSTSPRTGGTTRCPPRRVVDGTRRPTFQPRRWRHGCVRPAGLGLGPDADHARHGAP